MIRISIPENFELGKPLYTVHALDKDFGKNAEVSYVLTLLTTVTLNNVTMSGGASASSSSVAGSAAGAGLEGTSSMKQQLTTNLNSSPAMQLKQKLLNNQASATTTATTTTTTTKIINLQQQQTSAYGSVKNSGGGGSGSISGTGNVMDSMLKNLFAIDARSGHLTLSRHLDYETSQRHTLIVTAMDAGQPRLSSNLTIVVEVQDVNDNPPVFERNEYHVKVLESMPVNSQVSLLNRKLGEKKITNKAWLSKEEKEQEVTKELTKNNK